jgi:chorismate synthase
VANSFGTYFKITSFGESHGSAMGIVIEGVPAGLVFDEEVLIAELARRAPGQSSIVTALYILSFPLVERLLSTARYQIFHCKQLAFHTNPTMDVL